jgi:uncharacterized protein (TIGR01777 family)
MQTIGVTGGTGLVGKRIVKLLADKGYKVIVFTRGQQRNTGQKGVEFAEWNAAENKIDIAALSRLDGIIHLAGESVAARRWTEQQKALIVSSRVEGTRFLVAQLRAHAPSCKVFVGASAIGYYGQDVQGGAPFTEENKHDKGFLGDTCARWEHEEHAAAQMMRTVILRIGIVLAADGGAFKELIKPTVFGVLPIPGNGRQVMSWIHADDLAALFVHALEQAGMNGTFNAVAPVPANYNEIAAAVAATKKGLLFSFHVPAFVIKLVLGGMSIEVLKSCTASAEKTVASGFRHKYTVLADAIKDRCTNSQIS